MNMIDVLGDMTEFERKRRIPYMLPSSFYGRLSHYGFDNEDDDVAGESIM